MWYSTYFNNMFECTQESKYFVPTVEEGLALLWVYDKAAFYHVLETVRSFQEYKCK